MNFINKFKITQPIAYKTLYNGFKTNKKSHIYLVSGDSCSPLKETAMLIAKSFICENEVLCCDNCNTCKRIENNTYSDLKIINKDNGNIIKDDIISLQEEFSLTPLEGKYKVYIINLIENGGSIVMNKLLKFIEEPSPNIYGILTTQNISKVLPTIISRCQEIKLIGGDKDLLFNELIKEDINNDDAYIVSRFTNSIDQAKELINDDKYNSIKDLSYDSVDLIIRKDNELVYYMQRNAYPLINKYNKDIKLYLNIINVYLMDYLLEGKNKLYTSNIEVDKKYIEKVISKIMFTISKLDGILNANLLLDKLCYEIISKEESYE